MCWEFPWCSLFWFLHSAYLIKHQPKDNSKFSILTCWNPKHFPKLKKSKFQAELHTKILYELASNSWSSVDTNFKHIHCDSSRTMTCNDGALISVPICLRNLTWIVTLILLHCISCSKTALSFVLTLVLKSWRKSPMKPDIINLCNSKWTLC